MRNGTLYAVIAALLAPLSAGAAESGPALEEVTVTARKREESLQNVSAAVTAISGADLEQRGVNDVRDLQVTVPNVAVGEVVGAMKIFMRGLGNTTNNRAEDPEVNVYSDGAVISRVEMQSLAFFDLERVEVLRGPQGTLYGRNSTGGAINLITAKPTRTAEGYARFSVGNYNAFRADGAFGGPLSDTLSARVAAMNVSRGGFGKNITSGREIDDDKRQGVRLHLQYDPSDAVSALLTAEYANQSDNSGLLSFYGLTFPNNQADVRMRAPGDGGFSDPRSRDAAGNTDPYTKRETWSVTGTVDWTISDAWQLRNILNYRRSAFEQGQDLDLSSVVTSPTTTPGIGTASVGQNHPGRQFSEELQLSYESGALRALIGAYYFDSTYEAQTRIGLTPTEQIRASLEGRNDTRAWAAFWNASYAVNDAVTLRAGGRYNDETREIVNFTVVRGGPTANLPPVVIAAPAATGERSFTKYTNEAGVDWRVGDDKLLYYTFSQGFRAGAGLLGQTASGITDPTTVDSHELGLKATWADGRLLTNIAVFDAKAKGLQRTQAIPAPSSPIGFATLFRNIPEYKTRGFELDAAIRPVPAWRLDLAATYLDAEFGPGYVTQDPLSPNTILNPAASLVNVSGNRPQLTSKWRYNVGTQVDVTVGSGTIALAADVAYRGPQFYDDLNRAPFLEDGYHLVNAQVQYLPSEGSWSVSLWGKNLGDEKRALDYSFSGLGRVLSKKYIDPRTYGVTFDFRF